MQKKAGNDATVSHNHAREVEAFVRRAQCRHRRSACGVLCAAVPLVWNMKSFLCFASVKKQVFNRMIKNSFIVFNDISDEVSMMPDDYLQVNYSKLF